MPSSTASLSPPAALPDRRSSTPRLSSRQRHLLTLASLAAVVLVARSFRLEDLSRPSDNYDEGVYLQSLLLMRHGYRPFVDIVATQGPLHLYLAYVSYALGGYTLAAARLGSVVASLAAVLGVAWVGFRLWGPLAGLGAALALALSPTYLLVSRQALPEAPATAFAALALGAAAEAYRRDLSRWRVLAGTLLGLACLIKPIVAPVAVPVFLLAADRRSWRSMALAPASTALVGLAGLLAAGGGVVLDQVLGWRVQAGQLDPTLSTVGHNVDLLLDKMFRQEQPAFYVLAIVGGLALIRRSYRAGLALIGWLLVALVLLLAYANLSSHLGATLLIPLSLLAGVGLAAGWSAVSRRCWRDLSALAALVALWYLASVPALLERDRRLVEGELSVDRGLGRSERAAVRTISRLTDPDDWVVTDAPYLAFLADRKVPPSLVDPSEARIRSGALTAEDAIGILQRYDPDTVVLWTGKLADLRGFVDVVSKDFVLVEQLGAGDDETPRQIFRDPAPD